MEAQAFSRDHRYKSPFLQANDESSVLLRCGRRKEDQVDEEAVD